MGRKKKYNFKGMSIEGFRNVFEFEEKLPVSCWGCAFHPKCGTGGTVTNKVCPYYKPYKALQELRTVFKYVPDDVMYQWFILDRL